ncbi:MAG: cadherin repeat domain-containing protein, partial [Methanosarcinales archaeon]
SVTGSSESCVTPTSLFGYNTVTNKLKVASTPLRSITCSTTFQVQVQFARTADASQYARCLVEVSSEEFNVAPVITAGACAARNVNERSPVGTLVGSALVATDDNVNQPLIWTIDSTTRFPFSIGVCDGRITVTDPNLNFTRQSTYVLPIKVTDAGIPPPLSASCNVTVSIIDINDPPSLLTTELSVYENSVVGTVVGTVVSFDVDTPASSLRYSWARTDSPDAFAISASGVVTSRLGGLDFEGKNVYYYRVQVTDGTSTVVGDLAIRLLNDNDAPVITSATTRSVAENTAGNTVLAGGAITGSDQDGDAVTFTLAPNTVFNIGSGNSVYVVPGAVLNFEVQPTYTLTLVATDARGASTSVPFVISLTNVNEAPSFVAGVGTRSVPESAIVGSAIGEPITATDPDAGTVLTYQILSVTPSSSLFSIDGLSGQLRVAAAGLDYELGPRSFTVVVKALDNGSPQYSVTTSVTVSVTDVQEPPVWSASTYRFTIAENSVAGSVVGTISAVDPEGTAVTLQLVSSSSLFAMSTSGQFTVTTPPNFESDAAESLVVTATDAGGGESTTTVAIVITNVNEAPVFPPDAEFRIVADGATAGTFVGAPNRAADPDAGQTLTYSIATNTYFGIDAQTGQISVRTNLPAAGGSVLQYTLTITARDNGSPALSTTQTVAVTLQTSGPINRAPTLASGSLIVPESTPIDTVLANL